MVPKIPPELSDKIVDCLASRRALARCCLVSKSWSTRSRRQLWKKISWGGDNDTRKLPLLLDFLHSSPLLSSYIVHLKLTNYYEPLPAPGESSTRGIVLSLLGSLPALRSLHLELDRFNLAHVATADFSESTLEELSIEKTTFSDNLDFHHFTFAFPRDRKSTRLNSSHSGESRMPSSA